MENKWRFWSRKDRVITHGTGLKTEPTTSKPQSHLLNVLDIEVEPVRADGRAVKRKLVLSGKVKEEALTYGNGQATIGALIIPTTIPTVQEDLKEVVERINKDFPSQSIPFGPGKCNNSWSDGYL